MSPHVELSTQANLKVLSHLRALRANLAQARDSLMHFKADRIDRDRLEPAARRVDDLMNMFVSTSRDSVEGSRWVAEIRSGVEQVTNLKAADALREAQAQIAALLDVMSPGERAAEREAAAAETSATNTIKAQ
jgi:hypothetical protein